MEKITDLVLFKKHGEKKKNKSGFSLKKKIMEKNADLVFVWKTWSFYDGFSCISKILRRNSTLDLGIFIN